MKKVKTFEQFVKAYLVLRIILAVLVVLIVLGLYISLSTDKTSAPSLPQVTTPPSSQEAVIEGEAVCLPHKITTGPQTMECAFGVKLDDGTYYGLKDSSESYQHVGGLTMGEKYQFKGSLKTEPSDRYQSVGTFTVTSVGIID
mgnify:CR=1 FL=1